ncbi:MAG TPA: 4-(cytidine 5'-diphospho)-2-C-methyl-D-erythritol kinase, partial [Elusimicrobia bacterium]|nr:4-(cytidine 5'-diphospho)-2-C-methyl-D-erythritol kinase [Elusimicrobiota bacterium]
FTPLEIMKYLAPAKVNLYLEILGRRADSYHRIQTVMQTVSLYDELEIEPLPKGIKFVSAHPLLNKNNLILQAVNLLQKFNKKKKGIKI